MRSIVFTGIILSAFLVLSDCNSKTKSMASWLSPAPAKDTAYGVYLFRNTFEWSGSQKDLNIHVSADNRYKLYVNGKQTGMGPARGDLKNWNFEKYDITPFLQGGDNVIAALVWNAGEGKPLAQISHQSGFYCASGEMEELNTGSGNWKVTRSNAHEPIVFGDMDLGTYYVCGPGDKFTLQEYPEGWTVHGFDDSGWKQPVVLQENQSPWILTERIIPAMEFRREATPVIVRTEGVTQQEHVADFPVTIPVGSSVSLLLDQNYLTVGYPEFSFSGGEGSEIKITYAEALYDKNNRKGNRNDIENKSIKGYYDIILPDGSEDQVFSPLWLRTFRYVQLDIRTGAKPLDILDFANHFSAYPFTLDATFITDHPVIDNIMEVGWRTLRLCSGETYFDCPYYEQLQYGGDTRAQMLITYALSKDDRLARNAMLQIWHSMQPEGITLSRYPALQDQKIPGFSLYWISMIYDYLMYKDKPEFLRQFLPGINRIIDYFESFLNDYDMLGPMDHGDKEGGNLPEYWYFFDWSKGFNRGIPQGVYDNSSSIVALHFVHTLQQAAIVMDFFNYNNQSEKYLNLADKIQSGVIDNCYDTGRGLIAQTPDKKMFSQHAQILGILTDAIEPDLQPVLMQQILDDRSLIPCSMYYQFYLRCALDKAGMSDRYMDMLDHWYTALDEGLTTFPEKEGNPRSDCHAWNSSPCYEFFTHVAGIKPAGPGFKTVHIKPHFGELSIIRAKMPHPKGFIRLDLKKDMDGHLSGFIELPEEVSGIFEWEEYSIELSNGKTSLDF